MRKQIGEFAFNLRDLIGSGYSSKVYKGQHCQTEETVAIKVISKQDVATPIAKTLLNNEIRVLKQLNHENLLKVFEITETANNIYIISEFCSEGDLANALSNGPLQEDQALDILGQLTQGVKALSNLNIIHRDIKLANILKSNGIYKLADFGFALEQQSQESIIKKFNVGTPLYMSPELIEHNSYSEKSDIWALGIVFYQMMFGVHPFIGKTDYQILMAQRKGLKNLGNTISENSKQILFGLLNYQPDQRLNIDQLMSMIKQTKAKKPKICKKLNFLSNTTSLQIRRDPNKRSENQEQNNYFPKQKDNELIGSFRSLDDFQPLDIIIEESNCSKKKKIRNTSHIALPRNPNQVLYASRLEYTEQTSPIENEKFQTLNREQPSKFLNRIFKQQQQQQSEKNGGKNQWYLCRTEIDSGHYSTDLSSSAKSLQDHQYESEIPVAIKPTYRFLSFLDQVLVQLREIQQNEQTCKLEFMLLKLQASKARQMSEDIPNNTLISVIIKQLNTWVSHFYNFYSSNESKINDFNFKLLYNTNIDDQSQFFSFVLLNQIEKVQTSVSNQEDLNKNLKIVYNVIKENLKQLNDRVLFARKWENQLK